MHRHTSLLAGIFPVFLVAVLLPEGVSGQKTHMTHLGTLCIDSCRLRGDSYMCESIDNDGQQKTMYCSPQRNKDQHGWSCRGDSPCTKWKYDYYWCYNSWGWHWGYCGLDNLNYYTSTYQALCYDPCQVTGFLRFASSCHTDKGWDYCSVRPNVDYYGYVR